MTLSSSVVATRTSCRGSTLQTAATRRDRRILRRASCEERLAHRDAASASSATV